MESTSSQHSSQSSPRSESPTSDHHPAVEGACSGGLLGHETQGQESLTTLKQEPLPSTSTATPESGIDRLLRQQQQEIMYELRRLKLGDRPVTGQGSKEAVERFFNRLQHDHNDQSQAENSQEQHRPEHVTVEVEALIERRPVSSMLRSSRFRTNLESALRGALSHLSTSLSPQVQTTANRVTSTPRTNSPVLPPAPPLPQTGASSTSTNVSQDAQNSRPQSSQAIVDVPPRPAGPALAEQWLAQEENITGNISTERRILLNLEQNQQEEFIAEVSELVQRQLVSSSLSGNFRNTLEHLMQNRIRDMDPTETSRVQHFVQSLPPRTVPRNDFSDLGINVPLDHNGSSDIDNISVISATAAVAVPQIQSQAYSREMASIKTQLQELRNMMRLSFDLQLDIQRAIRQEVAAAVNSALSGSGVAGSASAPHRGASAATATSSSANPGSQPISESQCLICIDKNVDSVLYQCGHMCVCYKCGLDLRSRNSHCPVCRAPIKDIIRAYRSNNDE